MVNPGPAISDDVVASDIVCLPSKNDTSEALSFDDDSVSASSCIDDTDPYRTCIWRATSPERCDRMVRNKPFVEAGETLVEGTIHLALAQNPVATSCRNIRQMEKALLTFLADNIGSPDTFEPACAFTVDSARDTQQSDGMSVESTALKYSLVFIKRNGAPRSRPANIFPSHGGRTLDACSDTDEVMCCSQYAIDGNFGAYCNGLGCDVDKCGSGRRPRQMSRNLESRENMRAALATEDRAGNSDRRSNYHDPFQIFSVELNGLDPPRHSTIRKPYFANPDLDEQTAGEIPMANSCSFYGQLTGSDFNDVVRTYSEFKPEMSRSLLDVDDTLSVAVCSSNRFSIEMLGTPLLTCDEFVNASCSENEDIVTEDKTPIKKLSIGVPLKPGGDPNSAETENEEGSEFSANSPHSNAIDVQDEELPHQTRVIANSCGVPTQSIFMFVALLLSYGLVLQSLE